MPLIRALCLATIFAAALSLGACADLRIVTQTASAIADATIPPKVAIVGANAFDALELTAKNILVACTPHVRPAACNDTAIRQMNAAVLAGRPLRNSIEASLAASPGGNVSKSAYAKLQAIVATITAAVNAYNAAAS